MECPLYIFGLKSFVQRADGSMRKTRKVKEGYVPPEDIGKFVCSAERAYRQRTHYVVGTSQARDPNARGRVSNHMRMLSY